MKRLLLVALLPLSAHADLFDIETVGVHSVTRHDPLGGANNFNPGAYVVNDKGFVGGVYYNSHYRMSYYTGWTSPEWYRMRANFIAVTGYFAPVTIVYVPSFKLWQEDRFSVWLSGSPFRVHDDGQSVLHISFTWRLK